MILQKTTYRLILFYLLVHSFLVSYGQHTEYFLNRTSYSAGSPIILKFPTISQGEVQLWIHNSYGSSLVEDTARNKKFHLFKIPVYFCTKSGILHWKLIGEKSVLQKGTITIHPSKKRIVMENYVGPQEIFNTAKDFAMLVSVPTDTFDNPLADKTKIKVTEFFRSQQKTDSLELHNLIGWRKIYAYPKTGKIIATIACNNSTSEEFTVDIAANTPENFTIKANQTHNYADGNQVITFTTSILKDRYGNVVSDGTKVSFIIQNNLGYTLQTSGNTIGGIATGSILHPESAQTWKIKAYVVGMAESNWLQTSFIAALSEIPVAVIPKKNKVIVGPLVSFIQQRIPDGALVTLNIQKNTKTVSSLRKRSLKGIVSFDLNKTTIAPGTYTISIATMGRLKEIKDVKLQ